jgi:nickel-type superoxide dismutase maturation protease
MPSGRAAALTLAVLASAGTVITRPGLRWLRRSWSARIAVVGHSMEPGLLPGDWLLVDPEAYRHRRPRRGDVVLATDPRDGSRLLIKRVDLVDAEGHVHVLGDAPSDSTDSRTFGALAPDALRGRAWFRYWPPRRAGPLRALRMGTP